ncbi:arsenate reductase (glutaredoxin) [Burkholderia glumae]|uniref:arsenate reductase (glutaredoxin) n=1 Tax=Burkholderia glumae TaxID=337 RepID=UPI0002D4C2E7|nr:arsenate reductase (glutaredoxin) [Burkholderia glumae]PJO23337.1 arsenate reductase (glutaredoxin) [Burkholderia glumae AU6208]QHE14031.1 arsenate reductase (glutaredoxin) [Burkholderia glumae AU6208]
MITIYHNPRCSKSRETLALLDTLNTSGEPVEVVEYLKAALTVAELKALHRQLDRPLLEMVRDNEAPFQELGLDRADFDDEALYQAIADHPVLLQRPIVVRGGKAVIGRPPEAVRVLFAPTM